MSAPARSLPVVSGGAAEAGSCDATGLLRGDAALERDGWTRRSLTDAHRADEAAELYAALGFEVHLAPPETAHFSPSCESCATSCPTHMVIYTRKKGAPHA